MENAFGIKHGLVIFISLPLFIVWHFIFQIVIYGHQTPPSSTHTHTQKHKQLEASVQFSSVQSLSCVRLFAIPWTAVCQASLSIKSWSLLKLMCIESLMSSNHLILCCRLPFPPSIFPSIRDFSNESVLHIRWPKYWSFSFSISPSKEYSELISFRMDWLDLLAVQGTLRSLLQHHSSKASILQHSVSFTSLETCNNLFWTSCLVMCMCVHMYTFNFTPWWS